MKPVFPSNDRDKQRGFAIIVTVTVLLLLAVIAVGLLTLSTVTLRTSTQGAAQAEARANARLALVLALGELQKAMGPDQRVTARAETMALHPRIQSPVDPNTPKAWWLGAAHSDPEEDITPANPNDPRSVIWLISGLNPDATSAEQIAAANPFENPVDMYGDKTIDLEALTGGQPIQAGSVAISDRGGRGVGGFAYFVDDNGMKAQLATTNPEVRNDSAAAQGNSILPGTYNLGILTGMESLDGVPLEAYTRLQSLNDLPLIGAVRTIARDKRLGYTTLSRGVLSDVRQGGLKRDLTIAFERDAVFDAVFPNLPGRGRKFGDRYVVMDEEKFGQSRELQENGYIHWEMFKDYYNIKKHIRVKSGQPYLDSIMITKEGLFNRDNNPFKLGTLGPHEIGDNNSVSTFHRQMPYGDYNPITRLGNSENYKHSPVIPVLLRMQQNAWLERRPPAVRGGQDRLRTNVQLWHVQYNPFNIGLNVVGDGPAHGPRIIHYPQVYFTHPGIRVRQNNGSTISIDRIPGFSGKRQTHVPHEVLLGAGRSHVFAFKADATRGRDNDGLNYEDRVRDLTLESIYTEYELASAADGDLTVDFVLERPSMMHGANSNGPQASHEVAQTMWAAFAYESINNQPGKRIVVEDVGRRTLNENSMASFVYKLRTTREPSSRGSGQAIRPLVDANIRAMFCNTKWDSPLGVPLLAAYSAQNEGVTDQQIPQMDTRDAPKGYAYWGAGDDPIDGYDRVILFDIPRKDLVSLGQLQHASIGRFSYEPTYIVGNSYANLRIPQEDWKASVRDTFSTGARGLSNLRINQPFTLYDASYLVNEVLWDSYVFTTIPQVRDNYGTGRGSGDLNPDSDQTFEGLLDGRLLLPNPRFIPYEPAGSSFSRSTLQAPSNIRGQAGGFYHNAGHLMVDGAFNINSTSVDAWEAFLSGTYNLPYEKINENGIITGFSTARDLEGVRFPRVKAVLGEGRDKDALDENYWTGFRSLSREEVRELAVAVVEEIKKRGPFLTLGEFVNRKLERDELGQRGALQAALDATVNAGIDSDFEEPANFGGIPEDSTQGAGFPGQLLQGDILQALSPMMSARSDTFTIRAYGESRVPGTGEVRARAWCEATVQRYPDPIADDTSANALAQLINPRTAFGRTFKIVSFRWLSANEI